jgi:hypothetical protein
MAILMYYSCPIVSEIRIIEITFFNAEALCPLELDVFMAALVTRSSSASCAALLLCIQPAMSEAACLSD